MSLDSSSAATATTSSNCESTSEGSLASTGYLSVPSTDSSNGFAKAPQRLARQKQNYRGQVRMDICTIGRYIFTHLICARSISTESKSEPNSFVEIAIAPYCRTNPVCFSTVYGNSYRPVFDEKLSMELPPNCELKRLVVKVWHVNRSRTWELIGCTSFGLHRIATDQQIASGWYYLLDEDIGLRRHVRTIDFPNFKKHRMNPNESKIILCKINGGYGFTVRGSRPAKICTVTAGSTAELHDLRQGDVILTVGNYDARQLTAREVAGIVGSCKRYVAMTVLRCSLIGSEREDKIRNGIVARIVRDIYCIGDYKTFSQHATASHERPEHAEDRVPDGGHFGNRQKGTRRPVRRRGTPRLQEVESLSRGRRNAEECDGRSGQDGRYAKGRRELSPVVERSGRPCFAGTAGEEENEEVEEEEEEYREECNSVEPSCGSFDATGYGDNAAALGETTDVSLDTAASRPETKIQRLGRSLVSVFKSLRLNKKFSSVENLPRLVSAIPPIRTAENAIEEAGGDERESERFKRSAAVSAFATPSSRR